MWGLLNQKLWGYVDHPQMGKTLPQRKQLTVAYPYYFIVLVGHCLGRSSAQDLIGPDQGIRSGVFSPEGSTRENYLPGLFMLSAELMACDYRAEDPSCSLLAVISQILEATHSFLPQELVLGDGLFHQLNNKSRTNLLARQSLLTYILLCSIK